MFDFCMEISYLMFVFLGDTIMLGLSSIEYDLFSYIMFVFAGDAITLGLSSIVYESKSIPMNICTDLQLPNLFQHLLSLVPLMQN